MSDFNNPSMEDSQELKNILNDVVLDNIVQVDYNQEVLKRNFSSILQYLQKLHTGQKIMHKSQNATDSKVQQLENDKQQLQNNVQNLQNENESLKEQLEQLRKSQENMKQEQINQKKELDNHTDKIGMNEKDIADLKNRLGKLETRIYNLESSGPSDGTESVNRGPPFDMDAFNRDLEEKFVLKQEVYEPQIKEILDELERLKKQIQHISNNNNNTVSDNNGADSQFVKDLEERVKELEDRLNKLANNLNNNNNSAQSNVTDSDIDRINDQLQQLQADYDNLRELLKKKVDTERFEREIASLRKLINQLTQVGDGKNIEINQGMSEEDRIYIEKLREQIENLEEELRKLKKEVDGNKQEYVKNKKVTDQRLDDLENAAKFNNTADSLQDILNKISSLQNDLGVTSEMAQDNQNQIRNLKKQIQNNQSNMNDYSKSNNNYEKGGDGISEELVDEKIRQCKEELLELIKALREEKISFEDLWKSEAVILEKVDEVAGALIKKLADKSDTKKALIYLEKKINQMYQLMNKGMGGNENDGLLVKRPMLWSCISCDKSLDQFQGKMGEYKNWAVFPPKETTPDRMGRFGKGYKSLLERSKVKEQRLRDEAMRMAQQQQMNDYQSQGGTYLPSINKPGQQQFNQTSQGFNNQQNQQGQGQMSQDI